MKKTNTKRTVKSSSSKNRSPVSAKGITCRAVKRILNKKSPRSAQWRSLSLWWGENCL